MRDTLGISLLPLVDVILVLLAAFMVAAPMMQQGTSVELPEASNVVALAREVLVVTVPRAFGACRTDQSTVRQAACTVHLGREPVPITDLPNRLRAQMPISGTSAVHLRSDALITYEHLVRVIDRIMEADAESVELVLEPLLDNSSEDVR